MAKRLSLFRSRTPRASQWLLGQLGCLWASRSGLAGKRLAEDPQASPVETGPSRRFPALWALAFLSRRTLQGARPRPQAWSVQLVWPWRGLHGLGSSRPEAAEPIRETLVDEKSLVAQTSFGSARSFKT